MPLAGIAKGMVHGQGGTVKVVAEKGGGRIPGVHLVGPHPTLSEAVGEVMLSLAGRGLHQV